MRLFCASASNENDSGIRPPFTLWFLADASLPSKTHYIRRINANIHGFFRIAALRNFGFPYIKLQYEFIINSEQIM